MATPADVVREHFPNADDSFVEYVVWGKTGFPCFWSPKEGESNADVFRRQVAEFAEAHRGLKPGEIMCDFCLSAARPDDWLCEPCREDWNTRDQRREEAR